MHKLMLSRSFSLSLSDFCSPCRGLEVLSSSSSFSAIVNVLNAVYCIAQARTHSTPLSCWRSRQRKGPSTNAIIELLSWVHDKVLEFSAFLHLRSTSARSVLIFELWWKQISTHMSRRHKLRKTQ